MTTTTASPDDIADPAALPRPPEVRGPPWLGSALDMRRDPLKFLVGLYHQLGPAFRLTVAGRRFSVLAGYEANLFLMKSSHLLNSERLFGGLGDQLGYRDILPTMDGEAHIHLRKQMKPGFSRSAVQPHVPMLLDLVEEMTRDWAPGTRVPVLPFMQRLVTEQLSMVLTGQRLDVIYDDLWFVVRTCMNVELLKTWPRLALRRPRYRRAHERLMAFGRELLRERREHADDESKDLVDDVMRMTKLDGSTLPEEFILASTVGLYFAGMDTVASTMAFMMYGALHDPDVHDALKDDADQAVAADDLFADVKTFENLHALALETLRLWPVAPFTPRVATESFAFEGYRIEKDEEVWIAQAVTHYLDDLFPDAARFDLARHKAPRFETRRKGVFAPFTLGAHSCLGAGLAEVQMMVTMAGLLSRFDLALERPGPVPVYATPLPNPGNDYAFIVKSRR